MSKLIFNPEKDMKELLDYGFEYVESRFGNYYNYYPYEGVSIYIRKEDFYNCYGILIAPKETLLLNESYGFNRDKQEKYFKRIKDKLIKANLIIDEEELNESRS